MAVVARQKCNNSSLFIVHEAVQRSRRLLLSTYLLDGRNLLTKLDTPLVIDPEARCWSKIAIFCLSKGGRGSRRNIAIRFGTEKTRMADLPDSEKSLRMCLFL